MKSWWGIDWKFPPKSENWRPVALWKYKFWGLRLPGKVTYIKRHSIICPPANWAIYEVMVRLLGAIKTTKVNAVQPNFWRMPHIQPLDTFHMPDTLPLTSFISPALRTGRSASLLRDDITNWSIYVMKKIDILYSKLPWATLQYSQQTPLHVHYNFGNLHLFFLLNNVEMIHALHMLVICYD